MVLAAWQPKLVFSRFIANTGGMMRVRYRIQKLKFPVAKEWRLGYFEREYYFNFVTR